MTAIIDTIQLRLTSGFGNPRTVMFTEANSADPDQTPQSNTVPDQGLHCLLA